MKNRTSSNSSNPGCGCFLLILVINLVVGSMAFAYSLDAFFAKDVAPFIDIVGGLFLGEAVIPIAIVCWVLKISHQLYQ